MAHSAKMETEPNCKLKRYNETTDHGRH